MGQGLPGSGWQRAGQGQAARACKGVPRPHTLAPGRPRNPPARTPCRICSEDIECSGLTIPKAVQYLSSQDEKCQAIGAYYIQHTCFQDESAKQQVSLGTPPALSPAGQPGLALGAAGDTCDWLLLPPLPMAGVCPAVPETRAGILSSEGIRAPLGETSISCVSSIVHGRDA